MLTERIGDGVEIGLEGELDLATAPQLEAELERIHEEEWPFSQLVVDLRALAFLDSAGLEVIVRLDRTAGERGYELAVVRGPRAVERLFAVMQLDRTLRIVDDPTDL
jgi:anti-sigma B factor antagonist